MAKKTATKAAKARAAAHAFDVAVGDRIQDKRKERGLGQKDLAAAIGASVPKVSRLESGDHLCKPYTMALIAKALNCKASDFIDGIAV